MTFRLPSAAVVLLAVTACADPSALADDGSDLQVDAGVQVLAAIPGTMGGDAFTIAPGARVTNDALHLTVRYGGGCARHRFSIFAGRAFMESFPVQALLVIRHDAGGDQCRALLTRDLQFDLRPIRDLYRQDYGPGSGTIILRIRGYAEGVRYEF